MGFVDDDETEVVNRGKEGGARADDDERLGTCEDFEPSGTALGHGLLGVDENDFIWEGLLKNADELAGEGDFGDEQDGGFAGFEGLGGESEVDIGFAATGDAAQEAGGAGGGFEGFKGGFLGRIEGDFDV